MEQSVGTTSHVAFHSKTDLHATSHNGIKLALIGSGENDAGTYKCICSVLQRFGHSIFLIMDLASSITLISAIIGSQLAVLLYLSECCMKFELSN